MAELGDLHMDQTNIYFYHCGSGEGRDPVKLPSTPSPIPRPTHTPQLFISDSFKAAQIVVRFVNCYVEFHFLMFVVFFFF